MPTLNQRIVPDLALDANITDICVPPQVEVDCKLYIVTFVILLPFLWIGYVCNRIQHKRFHFM